MQSRTLTVCLLALAAVLPLSAAAQAQQTRHEADRVIATVDTQRRHALHGHLPGWARPGGDLGAVTTDIELDHLTVVLARSAATQTAFDQLLADQQNPSSPRYQQWLTPQQLGEQFGPTDHDVNAVTQWLASQGLRVDAVSPSRTTITFSGASSAVGRALGTEFHRYKVNTRKGVEERLSINSEPTVPAALAPVIAAFNGLSEEDIEPQSISADVALPQTNGSIAPLYTTGSTTHYIAPADFVTIFDIKPVYNTGIDGSGIKVAIIGRSRVLAADITAFQTNTGLSTTAQPVVILPGADPGTVSGDQGEQTLDVNRVMSTAPGAEADLVINSNLGTAIQYEINTLVDPVMTISYGACEASAGSSNDTTYSSLFSTAAAEGITTFISSGDSAAAACAAAFNTPPASTPLASINYLCANQYVTCVGGTELADTASPSTYWSSSNGTGLESAISYIPEGAWNEPTNGSGFQIAGTGGGVSQYITKPSWQAGVGVPADGFRDTPDIALPAAGHDGYYSCLNGSCASAGHFTVFSGTSAAAPGMAGIMALVVQKLGNHGQGNFNPTLYRLAGIPALNVFHDTTPASSGVASCSVLTASMCNNSTPSQHALTGGLAGYALTAGYDLATGWGSVDVANLITAAAASYTLTPAAGTLVIASPGATTGNTFTITATSLNSFAGTVSLTCAVTDNFGTATDLPTCSLAPSSVTLTANSTANSVVTIQTTAAQTGSNGHSAKFIFGAGGALACMLLCLPLGRKRHRVSVLALLLALMTMSGGLSGCGGGGTPASNTNLSNLGTTLGNYTVTVTGSFSGAATATSFTLTVN
jgi:pseudomonalisin